MARLSTTVGEEQLASVPVATLGDGTTVQSVVVPATGDVDHQYWLVRDDGHVLARFASLAAVDEWRAEAPPRSVAP